MADGQRRALFGIGGRAQFVEQHQRMRGRVVRDEIDVGDVRRKRGQVLLDRLVVADVGEDGVEDRQLGALGRNRNSRLRHQRQQSDGLQRDGLAAGVGAADDELAMLASSSTVSGTTATPSASGCAPAADGARCAGSAHHMICVRDPVDG